MSVQQARRRPRLSREQRREQLLEAALSVFVERGYHGAQIEDVIQAAGVARGTFYLHFESKHAVFAALVDRVLGLALAAQPVPPKSFSTRDDYRAHIASTYRAFLTTVRANRPLFRLLLEEAAAADKSFADRIDAFATAWRRRISARLGRLAASGLARPDLDVDLTVELLIGMTERVGRAFALPDPEPDLEHLIEALSDADSRLVQPLP
jgi:AcrR family transcriptional regulator